MSAKRPDDLGPLSAAAFDVLARYTAFPWPVMKTQAERRNLEAKDLDAEALGLLVDDLAGAVARFTTEAKGALVRAELHALATSPPRARS